MQTININYKPELPNSIRVFVDGVCNHVNTDGELVENFSGVKGWVVYCEDCGAEYNELDGNWINTEASYV